MENVEKKFFIGIDLGWKEKKTTGVCILEKRNQKLIFEENYCQRCKDVFGKNILKVIAPYLKNTAAIAIDAPLTKGRGKGKMRLYEKFLSTEIFRQEKVTPIPPALMPKLCNFGKEIRQKLEKRGFVLDINLIEVFSTLIKKLSEENLLEEVLGENFEKRCQSENQKSALICALLAYLHINFKTRYLGYKDGFLFLPEMSFWKKEWRQKFYQAWMARSRLKYHYLITNVFAR
jgi:predicted nuclease with RNAse H fold